MRNKIVNLLNPKICLDCNFSGRAIVTNLKNEQYEMIRCHRFDCDNWDYSTAETALKVEEIDEGL